MLRAFHDHRGYAGGVLYVLAALAVAAPVVLAVQTIRGRVKPQCCATVDVRHDARMRDAFADDQLNATVLIESTSSKPSRW